MRFIIYYYENPSIRMHFWGRISNFLEASRKTGGPRILTFYYWKKGKKSFGSKSGELGGWDMFQKLMDSVKW